MLGYKEGKSMSLGLKIAEGRKKQNLTQEQLAELLNVTRQSVSRWEQDTTYPEMDKLVRLAEVLNVSCDYLLKDNVMEDTAENAGKIDINHATRLLTGMVGKTVRLSFIGDDDMDLLARDCVIREVEGQWMHVEYKKGKNIETKLVSISEIFSIMIVDKGEK